MLDVIAIARCHRCNVISLPLHPSRSDPTYAAVSLPHDWQAIRWFADGQDEDYVLCPECSREALEWIGTKVARKPTSDSLCNARSWDGRGIGGDFCDLPKGHDGPHQQSSIS